MSSNAMGRTRRARSHVEEAPNASGGPESSSRPKRVEEREPSREVWITLRRAELDPHVPALRLRP